MALDETELAARSTLPLPLPPSHDAPSGSDGATGADWPRCRKEIFSREPVSNALDALDKIRCGPITDPEKIESQPSFYSRLVLDTNPMIVIEDSGTPAPDREPRWSVSPPRVPLTYA